MQATNARRLLESKRSIPHYRLAVEVDLTALPARRAQLNAGGGNEIAVNDQLVRAAALALVKHGGVNAQLQGDEVVRFPHAGICGAVAKVATFTLSCDHGVVDGAAGAQFLATLRKLVGHPDTL